MLTRTLDKTLGFITNECSQSRDLMLGCADCADYARNLESSQNHYDGPGYFPSGSSYTGPRIDERNQSNYDTRPNQESTTDFLIPRTAVVSTGLGGDDLPDNDLGDYNETPRTNKETPPLQQPQPNDPWFPASTAFPTFDDVVNNAISGSKQKLDAITAQSYSYSSGSNYRTTETALLVINVSLIMMTLLRILYV